MFLLCLAWFLIHYKDTCPHFTTSKEAEKELNKFITDYEKTETFLKNEKWVKEMSLNNDNFQKARQRAERYSIGSASYSNIYKAISKLFNTVL